MTKKNIIKRAQNNGMNFVGETFNSIVFTDGTNVYEIFESEFDSITSKDYRENEALPRNKRGETRKVFKMTKEEYAAYFAEEYDRLFA